MYEYMHCKSSYISTDLFINWLVVHFRKYKFSGKFIIFVVCHKRYCVSTLLLQTAAENNVTVILLPSHCTHTLQTTDK
jgi:hypothetical protein